MSKTGFMPLKNAQIGKIVLSLWMSLCFIKKREKKIITIFFFFFLNVIQEELVIVDEYQVRFIMSSKKSICLCVHITNNNNTCSLHTPSFPFAICNATHTSGSMLSFIFFQPAVVIEYAPLYVIGWLDLRVHLLQTCYEFAFAFVKLIAALNRTIS